MTRISFSIAFALSIICTAAPAQDAKQVPEALQLAGMFRNHMVFQRECDAAVWGTAKPGARVVVSPSWAKESFEATADKTVNGVPRSRRLPPVVRSRLP